MLSPRQLILLSYLVDGNSYLSSSYLSEALSIPDKTVKDEIRAINQALPENEQILFIPGSGYRLPYISSESIDGLTKYIDPAKAREDNLHAMMLSLLIFEDGYTSMEALATRMMLPEATISKEFESTWPLRDHIELSPKGLRINMTEARKRYLLSGFFVRDRDIPIKLECDEEYRQLVSKLRDKIAQTFIAHGCIVSGDAIKLFISYLAICVLRTRQGFLLDGQPDAQQEPQVSSLMLTIMYHMNQQLGYVLEGHELCCCQSLMNELNVVESPRRTVEPQLSRDDLTQKYARFLQVVKTQTGIDYTLGGHRLDAFMLHMRKLCDRISSGGCLSSPSLREINRQYPLTAHILGKHMAQCFQMDIPDEELSLIIPYFANRETHPRPANILLVSNQHPGFLHSISDTFLQRMGSCIRHMEFTPVYKYYLEQSEYDRNYPLMLTTESELLVYNRQAVFVAPVSHPKQIDASVAQALGQLSHLDNERITALHKSFLKAGSVVFVEQNFSGFDDLSSHYAIPPRDTGYDVLLDSNMLFIPVLSAGKPSRITIYVIKQPFIYKGRDIEAVISTHCNPLDVDVLDFYKLVRGLLSPGMLKDMLKDE